MPNVGDIIRADDINNIKSSGFIGQIIEFPSNLIPSNTLLCDGSEISRETYSELFNVIGTIYGEGDGSTTFNIPDYRGAFLRCTGGNADVLGTLQEDAIRNITGEFYCRTYQCGQALWNFTPTGAIRVEGVTSDNQFAFTGNSNYTGKQTIYFNSSWSVLTAEENRPINYSVNICIIYE